ncbi:MAG: diadenylate cyclase CdaA [Clostridia bacterium]|nr:diadenylate cyclase CdaA [Clostridia bacterium]
MGAFLDYLEYVGNQLKSIRIVDVIDIFIVAFLLYWVFKFVSGRRAGKLLIGLVILVAFLGISTILDMRALNFILTNLFSVGVVAIVIVFQPELRSALEKVGIESLNLRNLKGKLDNEEQAKIRSSIHEISIAAQDLSYSKTGALIVFERNTRLGDYIRTGTTIDALASSFLIGNIFFNKAPLHDGAVIIRNGRVHAAGCFLPLSANSDIVKELGTRHRAAIGMSENSDAVVLVVSEETGGISVAVDGKLKRNIGAKNVENYLTSLLIKEEKETITTRVRGRFTKKNKEGESSGKEN